MALVSTALTFVTDYVPYERPPQPDTLWSAIPRGLLSGIVNAGTLDAKPVNDDQTLTCTMTLPPNFGYVMADSQLTVNQNRAGDWRDFCTLRLNNFYRGAPANVDAFDINYVQGFIDIGLFSTARAMSVINPWPSFPILAVRVESPTIVVLSAHNAQDAVATAGTVDAFVSFWQFDLEQIRKFPINSPIPTHSR